MASMGTLRIWAFISMATLLGICETVSAVNTVYIEDCVPGKYFWRDESPDEFYACLTLPNKAVKMQCSLGTKMCDTGPELFQPCSCTNLATLLDTSAEEEDASNSKVSKDPSKTNDITVPVLDEDVLKMKIKQRTFYKSGVDSTSLPKLDDPSNSGLQDNEVSNRDIEPSMPSDGCPDDSFKKVANAHMYRGIDITGTLIECQEICVKKSECLGVDFNNKLKQCYYLDMNQKETIRYGLNYHDDIDHYRRTHCISTVAPYGKENDGGDSVTQPMDTGPTRGVTGSAFTLRPGAITPSVGTTFPPTTTNPTIVTATDGAQDDTGTTTDTPTFAPTTQQPPSTPSPGSGSTFAPTTSPAPAGDATTPSGSDTRSPTIPPGTGRSATDEPSNRAESYLADKDFADNVTPQTLHGTTTTIPDSGCPWTFQKYVQTSHPFGKRVPLGVINNEEACKDFCLKQSPCVAVDWNSEEELCYMLREILPDKVSENAYSTHYRKIKCAPMLKCYSETKLVKSLKDLSVISANTPQTSCHGVCFASTTMTPDGQSLQRGCMTITAPDVMNANSHNSQDPLQVPLACSIDGTLKTVVCFCDTARCNGLSITALASQMLHLPLDGDLRDHSGIGRDGIVPAGFTEPQFSCLDKAVNCSALFDGTSCVSINSMSQVQWGSTDSLTSEFIPTATFAIWFKRATTPNSQVEQGLFGNSIDTTNPSWRFIAEMLNNYIGAGIATNSNPDLDDFPWAEVPNDKWHLAVMTYQGVEDPATKQFSLLELYIDGKNIDGNARANKGEITIRNQPVTIGCVAELSPFIGFIDEPRIFNYKLDEYDIMALQVMADGEIYW